MCRNIFVFYMNRLIRINSNSILIVSNVVYDIRCVLFGRCSWWQFALIIIIVCNSTYIFIVLSKSSNKVGVFFDKIIVIFFLRIFISLCVVLGTINISFFKGLLLLGISIFFLLWFFIISLSIYYLLLILALTLFPVALWAYIIPWCPIIIEH
jgi:hypothetical protein